MAASTSAEGNSKSQTRKDTRKSKKGKKKSVSTLLDSAVLESDPWEQHTPWNWTSLTDPSSSRISPFFTRDGSYFFSLVGSSVKIHSTTTGLVVSTLTAPPSIERSDSNILTSAIVNPHNPFQLITGTLHGRILIWDFVNATLLQTINVGQHIHLICAHEELKGSLFVAASLSDRDANDKNAVVLQIPLERPDPSGELCKFVTVGKTRFPTGLAMSPHGDWLVATAGHKVYIAKTSALSDGFTKYVSPESLTCLAFHPVEDYFATGDSKGVVRIWYCLNDDLAVNVRGVEKRTQTRPLHWHAHAVSSVAFTANGAYLLSGGEEAVLVIWQLHTGKKEFVPRVGAPISTISVTKSLRSGEEEYLLGLTDATYVFVSSTSLKISRSYARLKLGSGESLSNTISRSVPLAIHPLTSSVILPSSHPSSIQLYSPPSFTLLSELEVSPSNRVSRRDEKPILPARVEKLVVSSSGLWMATVDSRVGDGDFRPEVYLKFWSWVQKDESWALNTRIDRPHGTSTVTDLGFNPGVREGQTLTLVSTGEDGYIKLWQLRSQPRSTTSIWVSYATLSFRSETPRSLSWSPDSSLLSVAVGPHVALYDPSTKLLRSSLTVPDGQAIQDVHFIGDIGRHLLASTAQTLILWDLVIGRVSWQAIVPLQISKVVPHPHGSSFVVFHTTSIDEHETKVSVFRTSSTKAISVYTLPFHLLNVVYGAFQANTESSLFGITHNWSLVLIGGSSHQFVDEGRSQKSIDVGRPRNRTLFQDMFGASAFADASPADEPPMLSSISRKVDFSQFDAPAFSIPSLDKFFDPLIQSFLTVRKSQVEDEHNSEKEFEDDDLPNKGEPDSLGISQRLPRSSIPGELELFTKLFRSSCIVEGKKAPPKKTKEKLNRIPHENINGPLRAPIVNPASVKKKAHLATDTNIASLDTSTSSPNPIQIGKKRKKGHS